MTSFPSSDNLNATVPTTMSSDGSIPIGPSQVRADLQQINSIYSKIVSTVLKETSRFSPPSSPRRGHALSTLALLNKRFQTVLGQPEFEKYGEEILFLFQDCMASIPLDENSSALFACQAVKMIAFELLIRSNASKLGRP